MMKKDPLGLREYRLSAPLFLGYGLLLLGVLVLGWEPEAVFAGTSLDVLAGLFMVALRLFLSPRGLAAGIACVFLTPALAGAFALSAIPLGHLQADRVGGSLFWMGLVAFFLSSLVHAAIRFRCTGLPQLRFLESLNARYQFEDGRPLISRSGLAMGPLLEAWLSMTVLVISWGLALMLGLVFAAGAGSGAGAEDPGESPFTVAGALVLLVLSLLRHWVVAAVVSAVHGRGGREETVFLERFSKAGVIVPR